LIILLPIPKVLFRLIIKGLEPLHLTGPIRAGIVALVKDWKP